MTTTELISLYLMAGFYVFAGVSHFKKAKFFLKMMPPWVPFPEKVNLVVGAIEILLGVGILFEFTRISATWGIILLLIAVFPANIYHFQLAKKKGKQVIPMLIRLPLQGLLIYWAYSLI